MDRKELWENLSPKDRERLADLTIKEHRSMPLTGKEQFDRMLIEEKASVKSEFNAIDREMAQAREAITNNGQEFSEWNSWTTSLDKSEELAEQKLKELEEDRIKTENIKKGKIPLYNAEKQERKIIEDTEKANKDIDKRVAELKGGRANLKDDEWELRKSEFMFPRPTFVDKVEKGKVEYLDVLNNKEYIAKKKEEAKGNSPKVYVKTRTNEEYNTSTDPIDPMDLKYIEKQNGLKFDERFKSLKKHVGDMDTIFSRSGLGGYYNQVKHWFKDIDRNQLNILPPNYETSDITLITRPTLPLHSESIRHDPMLRMLDTNVKTSKYFYIRCLLDKIWVKNNTDLTHNSDIFEWRSPWLTCVTNGLLSISGFPDPTLETKTTEGGYHQEDQTYIKGGLGLYRSVTLNLNFKDIQGGILMTLFEVWCEVMSQLRDGSMISYLEYIDRNILPYTVSIYRFNLDPTKTYITNWAKATTCFPLSYPMGAIMNVAEHQRHITSSGQFTIPFMANFISYNKITHLLAFNRLTETFCPGVQDRPNLPNITENNYKGLPYIESDNYGFKLVYRDITK